MLEEILDSKVKIKIASLFAECKDSLTVSDVARILKISKSRTSECLRDLHQKGILERKFVGRSILYSLSSSRLAKTVVKSLTQDKNLISEIEKSLLMQVKKLNPVSLVIFGSALKKLKTDSDVDFLLIYKNDIDEREIYRIVAEMSQEFGLHISITSMNLKEFIKKAKGGEEFILKIIATNKLIHGKDLEELIW